MSYKQSKEMIDLPQEIPIFPLQKVILLPGVRLPLNIFEPRYLEMVRASLGSHRLIGIIQTCAQPDEKNDLFPIGCTGRIVSFEEAEEGRYLITLLGVCRFKVAHELPLDKGGFRHIIPDWQPYNDDIKGEDQEIRDFCRETFTQSLRTYLAKNGMICDKWHEIKKMPCDKLIATLSVVCPFDSAEKQALLEASTLSDRAHLLQSFIEHAIQGLSDHKSCRH